MCKPDPITFPKTFERIVIHESYREPKHRTIFKDKEVEGARENHEIDRKSLDDPLPYPSALPPFSSPRSRRRIFAAMIDTDVSH